MTRKYQKIMRSITARLEMKESDILNMGQNTLPSNQLPRHITPPYPQSSHSCHLYPHICDLKATEDKQVINHRVSQLKFTSLKNFCLLSDREKEVERVN